MRAAMTIVDGGALEKMSSGELRQQWEAVGDHISDAGSSLRGRLGRGQVMGSSQTGRAFEGQLRPPHSVKNLDFY